MTNFKDISDLLQLGFDLYLLNNIFFLGILFINIGIFFKISLAPFHM
jgi:NADH:ubiquinone oxidoreductase subunit 2 (subunit N)